MSPPFSEKLRKLVESSDLSLLQIAAKAEVPYQPLQRWIKGVTVGYNLLSAERVFFALTGKSLADLTEEEA